MLLDCDACLARIEDKPRYCRSKVGLSEVNGIVYIVIINSKIKEKLKVTNINKLYNSSISFKNPDLNLMIKNADSIMLKLLFIHLKRLVNGEKIPKLPEFDQIKNEKPKITNLNLVGNDFDSNVFKNTKLNRLSIEKSTRILPRQIWNLNYLAELNLINCGLVCLPERLIRLGKTLKLLNLSNNKLIRIDKLFFVSMTSLVSLNLSNNQINFIPLDIVMAKNLVTIDLSNNQLTNLPYTIVYLKRLAELNLSSNQIKLFSSSIWTGLSNKLKLNKLDISNNYSIDKVNQNLAINKENSQFKIPTLRQLTGSFVMRKPQLFCNLIDFIPARINDELEQDCDLCFECKKPFSGLNYFESIHVFSICDLANGQVLNEEARIWMCKNLCSTCKFNVKFKRLSLD